MMAIDTVMLSFCEDCEANGGEPRKAPPLLLHALNMAAAAEEERAASGCAHTLKGRLGLIYITQSSQVAGGRHRASAFRVSKALVICMICANM